MAENSAIEWCHHTFNPWVGCAKISPACDHCYAESWAKRSGLVQWGPHAERRRTSASNWKQPVKWNAEAARLGVRYRVFCASLADVFDSAVPSEWRVDLLRLIADTPHLDWLLLSKRIGNAHSMMVDAFRTGWPEHGSMWERWSELFPHVWLGATICNQEEADRDIPKMFAVPARVRFLSVEPMLGPIDLSGSCRPWGTDGASAALMSRIGWVIAGGESGPGARPSHPDWFRSLRDQCAAAGVAFFMKQLSGERGRPIKLLSDFPADLQIREYPHANP